MTRKILARLAMLLLVLFGVTLLTFFYTNLSPVDAAQALAVRRYTRPTEEQITAVRAELGLDRPLPEQYINWLGNAIRGDFEYLRGASAVPCGDDSGRRIQIKGCRDSIFDSYGDVGVERTGGAHLRPSRKVKAVHHHLPYVGLHGGSFTTGSILHLPA